MVTKLNKKNPVIKIYFLKNLSLRWLNLKRAKAVLKERKVSFKVLHQFVVLP